MMPSNKISLQERHNILTSSPGIGCNYPVLPVGTAVVAVVFATYRLGAWLLRMAAPESRESVGGERKQGIAAALPERWRRVSVGGQGKAPERRGAALKGLMVAAAVTAAVTIIPGPAAAFGPLLGVVAPSLFSGDSRFQQSWLSESWA